MEAPNHGEGYKCPFCTITSKFLPVSIRFSGTVWQQQLWAIAIRGDVKPADKEEAETIQLKFACCPHCGQVCIGRNDELIFPRFTERQPAPKEVPQFIAKDYNEACQVETISQNASGALARRCLQNLLRNLGVKPGDLIDEIEEAKTKLSLPSHLVRSVDMIRHVGAFASHPIKSKNTGEIVEVESGEVELTLDTLEELFDSYYVKPIARTTKLDKFEKKLSQHTHKSPLKS